MQQTDETAIVLESLVETLESGRRGFGNAAAMLARDGREDLASQMRQLSGQRSLMAAEMREVAGSSAESGKHGEKLAGAMHRGWMALRTGFHGSDAKTVLAAAEQGEDHAVDEFRKAVRSELPAQVRVVVERQAAQVKTAHDRVRALRESIS